jgi:hypothetical protein
MECVGDFVVYADTQFEEKNQKIGDVFSLSVPISCIF